MSNWLDRVRAPKYLRYFFYIAYSWYRPYKSDRSDAHFNSIVFLATIHILVLLSIISIFFRTYFLERLDKSTAIGLVVIVIGVIHYILFFKNKKWKSYIEEFSHLKKKDRRRGTLYLLTYLFIIILFFIFSCWMIMQTSPHYK
ncbi:hypothetical protein [Aquimarina longa]|uniref:hypothetical protein n=1 Tax=Aquimarina longa TaxID=1080221 RepID=UPI0007822CCD|nr:hypothetical protein [Aquimarina longa]